MIKTTVTLTCDRCGREIKAGDRYYVESIALYHFLWDGENLNNIEGEDVEQRTCDLCEACRIGLYGPKEKLAEPTTEETQAITTPATVAEKVADGATDEVTETSPVEQAEALAGLMPSEEEMEAEPECTTESAVIAEDVATGEAVELDGKACTECQPEPTPETREVAARIIAMGKNVGKKQRKRLTDDQKEQIVRMMQCGATMEKVAKAVGCSPQTVCNVWRKYNTIQEAQDGR